MRIKVGKVLFILMIMLLSIGASNSIKTQSLIIIDVVIVTGETVIGPVDHVDFSNFTLNMNNPNVPSSKSDDIIYFSYNGCSTHNYNYENYVLDLGLFGNVTEFDVTVRFQFNMTYLTDIIYFAMVAGSYYSYDLSYYYGLPSLFGGTSYLAEIGIKDPQPGESASYYTSAYPYGIADPEYAGHSSAGLNDVLEVQLIRNFSGLYAECREPYTNNIHTGHYWADGIDIPVNYILMDFYSGYSSNVNVTAFDFEGSFYFSNESVIPDTNSPVVEITSPVNGTNIYGNNTVDIKWDVSDIDSNLRDVQIALDYGPWINISNPLENKEYTFLNISEGYHLVTVRAYDYDNNKGEDHVAFGVFEESPTSAPPTILFPGFTYLTTILSAGLITTVLLIIKRRKKR